MSASQTGLDNQDKHIAAIEGARQSGVAAAATRAAVVSADATFYRGAVKLALANNCGVAQYMTALAELGQSLYP